MSAPINNDAKTIESKVFELLEKYKLLKEENAQLLLNLQTVNKELEESRKEIVRLKTDYGRLKIAKVYGWDEQNKRLANDKISKLVRDIDKCLDELNNLEL